MKTTKSFVSTCTKIHCRGFEANQETTNHVFKLYNSL